MISDLSSPHANANSATSYQAILNTLPDSFSEEKKGRRFHAAFHDPISILDSRHYKRCA